MIIDRPYDRQLTVETSRVFPLSCVAKMSRIIPQVISATLLMIPAFAHALTAPSVTLSNLTPKVGTLWDFINLLIDIIQWIALPALAFCIIYAGYMLVSAGGNDEQITKAKRWIVWTLVGAAIILGAHVIAGAVCGTAQVFDSSIICPS